MKLKQIKNIFIEKLEKFKPLSFLSKNKKFLESTDFSLNYQRKHDDKKEDNRTSPKDDAINLHCVWASEVYPPSMLENLTNAIKNIGWEYHSINLDGKVGLSEWIIQNRSNVMGSGWFNGGVILNPDDDKRFIGGDIRRSKLPKYIDYCKLSVANITSSLTIVSIQFRIKEEFQDLTQYLQKDKFQTEIKYRKSGLNFKGATYINIERQKREAIEKHLSNIHESIYKWFDKNLPGLYLKHNILNPTVDLITSEKYSLKQLEESNRDYIRLLFPHNSEIWQADQDLPLVMNSTNFTSSPNSLKFFGNFNHLTKDNESYGGSTNEGICNKLDSYLHRNIDLIALHTTIKTYEDILVKVRDKSKLKVRSLRHTINDISKLKEEFLSINNDLHLLSEDIISLTEHKKLYEYDHLDFLPPKYYKGDISNFLELLRQQDNMRIKSLKRLTKAVENGINTDISLMSTITNLKIQRNIILLTILTIILSVIAMSDQLLKILDWIISLI